HLRPEPCASAAWPRSPFAVASSAARWWEIASRRLMAGAGRQGPAEGSALRGSNVPDDVRLTNGRGDASENEALIGTARADSAEAFGYTADERIDRAASPSSSAGECRGTTRLRCAGRSAGGLVVGEPGGLLGRLRDESL